MSDKKSEPPKIYCSACNGNGYLLKPLRLGAVEQISVPCTYCNSTGYRTDSTEKINVKVK